MKYDVYTDGSCLGNPGPGGWSVVIHTEDGELTTISGHEDSTTNNRMELTAVIEALKELPLDANVTIHSDSQYVVYTITKGWKKNKNLDLWIALDELLKGRSLDWDWIRGHNGSSYNELADVLAKQETGNFNYKRRL